METWAETVASVSDVDCETNPCQRLKKRDPEDVHRVEWRTPRSCQQVAAPLLEIFRQLVTGQARWPLYLWGLEGRGKTLALLSLCDLVSDSRYFTPNILMNECTQAPAYLPWGDEGRRHHIQLAIMDEVGSGDVNAFHFDMVLAFVDERERRHNRVGAYASNLSPEEMKRKYDPRVASRMLCGTIYKLTGPDRRLQQDKAVEAKEGE